MRQQLAKMDDVRWRAWRNALEDESYLADLQWLTAQSGRAIIPYSDPAYPVLLKQIPDPPPVLFVQGDVQLLSAGQLAVVGSRQATPGALNICTQICQGLVGENLVITSGLALGADGQAHRAALEAGGKTVAVVATGLDRVYPARHRELAHRIAESGAIVSEFPIGTGVRQTHFPRRNRIISGLALGVLVIEASMRSGSLITARLASEQGREVFAIPGSVHNPLARGCHQLIREGAKLTECADDVLEELLPLASASAWLRNDENASTFSQSSEKPKDCAEKPADGLLSSMGYDPCRVDDLVERTRLTSEEISAMLLMLELDGQVESLPGGLFQRSAKHS